LGRNYDCQVFETIQLLRGRPKGGRLPSMEKYIEVSIATKKRVEIDSRYRRTN